MSYCISENLSGFLKMYLQKIAATRLEITPQKKTKSNNREKGDREGDGWPLRLFYTGHFLNKKTA